MLLTCESFEVIREWHVPTGYLLLSLFLVPRPATYEVQKYMGSTTVIWVYIVSTTLVFRAGKTS